MAPIHNVAIIGGTGNSGSIILSALLSKGCFSITAISRAESKSTFPSSVTVKRGSYTDPSFMTSALSNIDALILTLPFLTEQSLETQIISHALSAGVKYIIPNLFGGDVDNPALRPYGSYMKGKGNVLSHIKDSGGTFFGIICNYWYDFCIPIGAFGFDIRARKVNIYDGGEVHMHTTTLPQVGRAVANLLSLPETSLETFKNKLVYINSFAPTQQEIFAAVRAATKTDVNDWTVSQVSTMETIEAGQKEMAKQDGNRLKGGLMILDGTRFNKDLGAGYLGELANRKLGLETEDLESVTEQALKKAGLV